MPIILLLSGAINNINNRACSWSIYAKLVIVVLLMMTMVGIESTYLSLWCFLFVAYGMAPYAVPSACFPVNGGTQNLLLIILAWLSQYNFLWGWKTPENVFTHIWWPWYSFFSLIDFCSIQTCRVSTNYLHWWISPSSVFRAACCLCDVRSAMVREPTPQSLSCQAMHREGVIQFTLKKQFWSNNNFVGTGVVHRFMQQFLTSTEHSSWDAVAPEAPTLSIFVPAQNAD